MFKTPSETYRVTTGLMKSSKGDMFGAFILPSCEPGWSLRLICDNGDTSGWEHVSVCSVAIKTGHQRIPHWKEMCQIKEICWGEEDVVMQLHPARRKYVNTHPYVLHMWRPLKEEIPVPPLNLV